MGSDVWEPVGRSAHARLERAGSHVTIALRSEIDMQDLPRLREFCRRVLIAMHRSLTVTIDLTGVTYLGTGGLRVMEQFCLDVQLFGGTVRVIAPRGSIVRRLLDVLGPEAPLTAALENDPQ
jgi:anti-anti-sigma factor